MTQRMTFQNQGIVARQRGVTLVIALMFMVALTLLGVGMVRSTTSEERMSANTRDYDVAFAAAEAALRDAEIRLQGVHVYPASPAVITNFPTTVATCGTATSGTTNLRGYCYSMPLDTTTSGAIPYNTTYTLDNTTYAAPLGTLTTTPTLQGVNTQPRYLVELMLVPRVGGTGSLTAYRITSRGFGRRDSTQVQLQEVVIY